MHNRENILSDVDTLIFDYDGTLHNSIALYGLSFRKAFEYLVETAPREVLKCGYDLERQWSDVEISKWLGFTKDEMWNDFMPSLSEFYKSAAGSIIGKEMLNLLKKGEARLYPNALETLFYLKNKGFKLVFLSNCSVDYMGHHRETFELDRYFDNYYCAGAYPGLSKADIMAVLLEQQLIDTSAVMIGDRMQDIEAGIKNGIRTVACDYGFGKEEELVRANFHINRIEDLKDLFK